MKNVIIPSLRSVNALNVRVYNTFLEFKKLFVYAGLSQSFENAIHNVTELNKKRAFGGSGRGLASKRLIENLKTLKRKTSRAKLPPCITALTTLN